MDIRKEIEEIISGRIVYRSLKPLIKDYRYYNLYDKPVAYNDFITITQRFGATKLFEDKSSLKITEGWRFNNCVAVVSFRTLIPGETVIYSTIIYSKNSQNELVDELDKLPIYNPKKHSLLWICYHANLNGIDVALIKRRRLHTIRNNLPDDVFYHVVKTHQLLKHHKPGVIVWYGPRGTGKTYTIRGLLGSLNTRNIMPILVLDPSLLMTQPDYILRIVNMNPYRKHILLIFDDAYSALDLRNFDLSVMNHVINGLCSQNITLLMTGQEVSMPTDTFRPGRVIQTVAFRKFTRDEAMQWLARHKKQVQLDKDSYSLAELYGIIEGWDYIPRNQIGFTV